MSKEVMRARLRQQMRGMILRIDTGLAHLAGKVALAGMVALAGLAGCSLPGSGGPQSPSYYVINDLRPGVSPSATSSGLVLMLGSASAAALYDSDRMVFTRDGQAFGYYQFAHWSERPGKRLTALAEQRLAGSGRFAGVVQSVAGVRGDWLLQLRLDELTHDDRAAQSRVNLRISAELIDWRSRALLGRRSFDQAVDVASRDARGAAQAASEASTRVLDALDAWIGSMVSAAPGARSSVGTRPDASPVPVSR